MSARPSLQDEINDRRDALLHRVNSRQERAMLSADKELRERCLQLAISAQTGDPVAEAGRFYDFIKGEQSPREKIDAALDNAGVK